MEPLSALLLLLIFLGSEKAIERVGENVIDALGKPLWEWLENGSRWLTGLDETSKRWKATGKAFAQAKPRFLKVAPHQPTAQALINILESFKHSPKEARSWLDPLSDRLEDLSVVGEEPGTEAITDLVRAALQHSGLPQPEKADLAEAVRDFISIFQDCLFIQPAYHQLMLDQVKWDSLRKRYDTRSRYLEQIIHHHQNLDFVGIPDIKDRQPVQLESVFVNLQAETEEPRMGVSELDASEHEKAWLETQGMRPGSRRTIQDEARLSRIAKRRLSLEEALRQNLQMIILGDPGAGKTTLLKYIALAFANMKSHRLGISEERLPIFVRLYDYAARRPEKGKESLSIVDYLYLQAHENMQLNLAPGFFESALERGECCVCLDGLDELGRAGFRRQMTGAVTALTNRYPRNRFLVTSRLVGYEEAPLDRKEFAHLTVLPFEEEDIHQFVFKWYQAREVVQRQAEKWAEELARTILRQERLKSLAGNPLMLTIIALVHRIEVELPNERVKLYDKCVTALVETWDKLKGEVISEADRQRPFYRYRRRLLEQLAYWMHSQEGNSGQLRQIKEGDLIRKLCQMLLDDHLVDLNKETATQEAKAFVTLVKGRTGLLVDRGEGTYAFSHLTFQEYLAACDIKYSQTSPLSVWKEIQPYLHDSHWREVILSLLGSLNEFGGYNTCLVGRILHRRDEYETVLHRHLFLAASALADRVEVSTDLHNTIVDRLLALACRKSLARNDAFQALGLLQGDKRVASGLLELARSPKMADWVRCAAAQALGSLGRADDAASILLELARNPKADDGVRSDAAQALGSLDKANEVIFSGLLELARDPKVADSVRRDAVQALGSLGKANKAVLNGLLELARDPKADYGVRGFAALALGSLGKTAEAVISGLLELARDPKVEGWARLAAALTLDDMGRADDATAILLELARDPKADDGVRSFAAQSLGILGSTDDAVLYGLLELARDPKVSVEVRRAAAQAFGYLGRADDAVLYGLLELARDPKIYYLVRSAAAEALGSLGRADDAVLNGLLELARDPKISVNVRRAAAQALGSLGRADDAASNLLDLARDPKVSVNVRSSAAEALGSLGRAEDAVLFGLLELARDPKIYYLVRSAAAQALGSLGRAEDAVLSGLLEVARDPKVEGWMRLAAVQALGSLGRAEDAVLSGLLEVARDPKVGNWVRRAAAEALGSLGRADDAVLYGLLEVARDPKIGNSVRYSSYISLKQLLGAKS